MAVGPGTALPSLVTAGRASSSYGAPESSCDHGHMGVSTRASGCGVGREDGVEVWPCSGAGAGVPERASWCVSGLTCRVWDG